MSILERLTHILFVPAETSGFLLPLRPFVRPALPGAGIESGAGATNLTQDEPEPTAETDSCESCAGMGVYDIGDCEDGVWGECPRCEGTGIEPCE